MAYFKIGNTDYSSITSGLSVSYKHKFKERDNALGNKTVDYITRKRVITVEIIPLSVSQMSGLLSAVENFSVTIKVQLPGNSSLTEISAKIQDYSVSYYRIGSTNTLFQKVTMVFDEL